MSCALFVIPKDEYTHNTGTHLYPIKAQEIESTHFNVFFFSVKLNLTLESGRHAAIHTLDFAHVWIVFNLSSATFQHVLYCV